ncbi:PepSY-associated TM helix domain-containing protein [Paracidovorax citrulli]
MKAPTLRFWYAIHRWTSLLCTLNLLVLCVTGLLLIFHEDIDALLGQEHHGTVAAERAVPVPAQRPALQALVDTARVAHPGQLPKSISFADDDEDAVGVRVGPAGEPKLRNGTTTHFDAATGLPRKPMPPGETFSGFILKLHLNLFLGMPGQYFIGFIGVLLTLSLISGLVLYGPFMRKLAFGLLRFGKPVRVVQADLHNLFGIVVLVWALVVGLTGTFLSFSPLIIGLWQKTELQHLVATLPGQTPPALVPVDRALNAAQEAVPGKDPAFVFYPNTEFSTGRHYGVVLRGHTELQKRVYAIVFVDAGNGSVAAVRGMPWYLQVLLLSAPFHFGDYAGRPLQILWALLTLITTGATVTGFIFWLKRPRRAGEAARTPVPSHLTGDQA